LLEEYGTALRRLAAAYELDRDEREDLLQEIAFGIWRALPTFRGECSERTFVYRIAHNNAISHGRRAATRGRAITVGEVTEHADPHPTPEQNALGAALEEQLLAAIQRLSPALRQTIVLSLEGLSNGEIAEVVGANVATVAVRLNRARDALSLQLRHVPRQDPR
jgi:RNA polymerase sigma factor (sigma-70 family)